MWPLSARGLLLGVSTDIIICCVTTLKTAVYQTTNISVEISVKCQWTYYHLNQQSTEVSAECRWSINRLTINRLILGIDCKSSKADNRHLSIDTRSIVNRHWASMSTESPPTYWSTPHPTNNNTLFKYIYTYKHDTWYISGKVDHEVIPIKGPLTEL